MNADVPEITAISVGEPDLQATPLGGKAVGELGIVGAAAPSLACAKARMAMHQPTAEIWLFEEEN